MPKSKFTFKNEGHFYASSLAEWKTDTDPEKLIKAMKAGGYNFSLHYVPLPEKAHYKIEHYSPVVEGSVFLGMYKIP